MLLYAVLRHNLSRNLSSKDRGAIFGLRGPNALIAFQGRKGGWGNNRVPILASFFFNFFPFFLIFEVFFLNYLAVAVATLFVNNGKIISTPILLPPFAGFQSAFQKSQPKC